MRSGKRDGGGADMSDANRYTELIAGAHFDQPRYQQFIYELTEPLNEARKRLAVFYKHFDVDTAVDQKICNSVSSHRFSWDRPNFARTVDRGLGYRCPLVE